MVIASGFGRSVHFLHGLVIRDFCRSVSLYHIWYVTVLPVKRTRHEVETSFGSPGFVSPKYAYQNQGLWINGGVNGGEARAGP